DRRARYFLEHGDQLFRLTVRQRLEQYAVHDGEDGRVAANADGESEDRDGGEAWMTAQTAESVPHVLAQHVEMLPRGRSEHAMDRVAPQCELSHRPSLRECCLAVLAERLSHLLAEVASKIHRKEPQELPKESIPSGHRVPRRA